MRNYRVENKNSRGKSINRLKIIHRRALKYLWVADFILTKIN